MRHTFVLGLALMLSGVGTVAVAAAQSAPNASEQKTTIRSIAPGSDMATDLIVSIDLKGGTATAHVKLTGHTLQDQPMVRDHETFSVDRTVPAAINIAVRAPQPVQDLPELPPELKNLPGFDGVDIPSLIGGGSVTIAFGVPQVAGEHHIEAQFLTQPPAFKCQRNVQDPPYSYAAPVMSVVKPLQGNNVDNLAGHDVKDVGGTIITTDWDLRND